MPEKDMYNCSLDDDDDNGNDDKGWEKLEKYHIFRNFRNFRNARGLDKEEVDQKRQQKISKAVALMVLQGYDCIPWAGYKRYVSEDCEVFSFVREIVFKNMVKFVLDICNEEDFLQIVDEEMINNECKEFYRLLSIDFDFPSECGFSPIRTLSEGTMNMKFSFLREPEVAYILEWYQEKCNVCKEDQVAAPIISTMAEKDYVLFDHYVRAVKEVMEDFVPLKEATKLNLMMDLEQGQNSVVEALLLEFWKDINLQHLENLAHHGNSEDYGRPARPIDDPNYFVSHINICCIFLVSQKVSALQSWSRLATFPLTCGAFGAFTKEAIEVVKIANLERIRQGQRFISVDHMLLGFSWSRIADNVRKFMDTKEAAGSEELETNTYRLLKAAAVFLGKVPLHRHEHDCDTKEASVDEELEIGPNYYIYRSSQDAAAMLGSDTIGLEHLFLATVFGRQATIDKSCWLVILGEKKVMEFLECVGNCEKSIGGAQEGVRRSEFEAVWRHVFPEYDGKGLIADNALSIVRTIQDYLRSNQFDPREYVNKEGYKQA
ncbi:hypothetical protein L1049_022696 [Liquidambar formosana]|uniref:Uncharacterized protein n=1 Tax=Liquidambar formosana TaxID=63359 RepID=A0AAP0REQ4_LIQFO